MFAPFHKKKIPFISTSAFSAVLCICIFVCIPPYSIFAYQIQRNVTLNWGELHERIQSFNPLNQQTDEEQHLQRLIYGDPLFYYDPYDERINPGIIERWTSFSDARIVVLVIKDDIVFHDNTPLKPEDVEFSINLYKEYTSKNNLPYNLQLDKLKEITVRGPRIFELELHDPIENLPLMLADIPILSRDYYRGETYGKTVQNIEEKRPFGFGPFSVSSLSSGSRQIRLDRHSSFYKGSPEFEHINLRLYDTSDQTKSDFITGKLDFIQINTMLDKHEISSTDTLFYVVRAPTKFMTMFTISQNSTVPILASKDIREAISMVFNKKRYPMSSSQYDVRSQAFSPLPESSWAFFQDLPRVTYNPAVAKRRLHRIGWNDSDRDGIIERNRRQFSLELLYPKRDKYLESLIQYVRVNLSEVGISIEAAPVRYEELSQRIEQKNFELALDYFRYYPMDVVRTFYDFFRFGSSAIRRNSLGVYDAQAIRQLRRAAIMPKTRDAKAIFHRLQYLNSRSYTNIILTYQHHKVFAVNAGKVTGFMNHNRFVSIEFWKPVKNR